MEITENIKKKNRVLAIIQATLEYFIQLGVSTTYLPKLGLALGMEESLIVLLSSFVSLGCSFQFVSIFLVGNPKPVKPWLIVIHILNQIFFSLIWFIPLFSGNKTLKIISFVVMFLSAYAMYNVTFAPTYNMYFSNVDDDKKGKFTATKEMISLITGMLFTLVYSSIVDNNYDSNFRLTFIICGSILIFITILHTLTLFFTKELPKTKIVQKVKWTEVFKNKNLKHIIIVSVLWYVALYSILPFISVLQYNSMMMTTLVISIVTSVAAVARIIFSRPFGKYADRTSYSSLLTICFIIELASFVTILIYNPSSNNIFGSVGDLFIFPLIIISLYYILFYVGMAGINGGITNIAFDYFDETLRTQALAVMKTVSGLIGFGATYLATKLKVVYDNNPLIISNVKIEFSQITAVFSIIVITILILYNQFVLKKVKKFTKLREIFCIF